MDRAANFSDWRPSYNQGLLLKAALLKGQTARQAWEEWSRTLDLSRLDYGSQRLLPLLVHNLKMQGIEHPFVRPFQRFYLDAWAKNQILFRKASRILHSLREAGIRTLVFKGISLIVHYYLDPGLRPMGDLDLLVATPQATEAIALLRKLGWAHQPRQTDGSLAVFLSVNHALHFSDAAKSDLDLHWHILSECLAPDADRDFWDGALPIKVNGTWTLALNPADELFHTCIHGVRWNRLPPIRWVADAVTILNGNGTMDWDRLIRQAAEKRLSLPLSAALNYVTDQFAVSIPVEVLNALDRIPISKMELKENKARSSRPGWTLFVPPYLWAYYPRIAKDTGRSPGLLGFIRYLQQVWELRHGWQVPLHAAGLSLKRVLKIPIEER